MSVAGLRQCLLLWSVDYWNLEGKGVLSARICIAFQLSVAFGVQRFLWLFSWFFVLLRWLLMWPTTTRHSIHSPMNIQR